MSKNKQKTRKSILKRFRLTKTGLVLFRGMGVRHLKRKKSKSTQRRQKVPHHLQKSLRIKVTKAIGGSK